VSGEGGERQKSGPTFEAQGEERLREAVARAIELLDCWGLQPWTSFYRDCVEGHRCPTCLVVADLRALLAQEPRAEGEGRTGSVCGCCGENVCRHVEPRGEAPDEDDTKSILKRLGYPRPEAVRAEGEKPALPLDDSEDACHDCCPAAHRAAEEAQKAVQHDEACIGGQVANTPYRCICGAFE